MALVHPDSCCALCSGKLDRPFAGTSGVAFPFSHELNKFCDAPLHLDCLEKWGKRIEFFQAYYDQRRKQYSENNWLILAGGFGWFLGFIPPSPAYPGVPSEDYDLVELRLEAWPYVFFPHAKDWDRFLDGVWERDLAGAGPLARSSVESVIRELRRVLPDARSLIATVEHSLSNPAQPDSIRPTEVLFQELLNAVTPPKRFAERFDAATSRDDLLMEMADALTAVGGMIFLCFEHERISGIALRVLKVVNRPRHDAYWARTFRLFCAAICFIDRGFYLKHQDRFSPADLEEISQKLVPYSAAVFANMLRISSEEKRMLQTILVEYFQNTWKAEGISTVDSLEMLIQANGNQPSPAEIAALIKLIHAPWDELDPEDFIRNWQRLR